MRWIRAFSEIGHEDVALVGGKNASLGEMLQHLGRAGVRVPDGFAVTAEAYRHFIREAELETPIRAELEAIERRSVDDLRARTRRVRNLILNAPLPDDLAAEIAETYRGVARDSGEAEPFVAVRSSATAEDLPTASFAGQQESFLHIHGEAELLDSVKRCFASLFTARAVNYRRDMGFDDFDIALSVGVQRMVRSDRGSAGVAFTLDTESGSRDVVFINASYGLGESVVQGRVVPDDIYVHKPTLRQGYDSLIWTKVGGKETRIVYDETKGRLVTEAVPDRERRRLSLPDASALELARAAVAIEDHYSKIAGRPTPMDIEWALDGVTGELHIVQARPETVHSQVEALTMRRYHLKGSGEVLGEGLAIGEAIGSGLARVIHSPEGARSFQDGDVLVTQATDPDWEPILKRAGAVVTEQGGRTSHAAIVARELGIPAVVAMEGARESIPSGDPITISCADGETGRVYAGEIPFEVEEIEPGELPETGTRVMVNLASPEQAFSIARLPADGVGLARMEFVFAGWVGIHPLALTRPEKLSADVREKIQQKIEGFEDGTSYFVDRLSQGIGTLAAAFYPRPVILRFSDFKTNEYAHLLGGGPFEPKEQNPMLGWRGASRYYHDAYRDGFLLEVEAVRRVRQTFGLKNLKLMIPFCRTPEEGQRVLDVLAEGGLVRGEDDLQVYVMAEIPSNVLLAERFAEIFDGFSIGSNDLTQLVLGIDRDSERVAPLFDERNEAVRRACAMLIETAHRSGRPVGICGQAPSDYPDFATFLVEQGIDSVSLSPDAFFSTKLTIARAEERRQAA